MALPIAQQRTDGLAPHSDPCASNVGAQNHAAYKNQKSRESREFLHAKSKTRIACWNVRTLGSLSDQSAQLLATIDTMKKKRIELLALSETRWPGYSWEAAGSVFHPVSDRIIRIRLKCHLSYVTVVVIYAPTNPSSGTTQAAAPSDTFYDQLQSVVSDVPPRDMLLVLGDFNARVGSNFQSWRSVIGPHGMGDCNGNGERLLDFCSNNQLLVTNTWFKHKPIHKTTWFRNGNRSRPGHIIDYILVNRRFRSSILDTRVYRSVLHESDHELVVSTLRFKIKTKRRQSTVPHRQTTNLHADIKSDFRTHLSEAYSHIPNDASIESSWSAFKSAINSACTVLPEVLSSHDPDWVTDELRNLSQKKSNAWLSYHDAAKRGYEVKSHREEYNLFAN